MRLLTVSNCDLIETQGSGYVIMNFVRGLERRGHQVTVVAPNDCIVMKSATKGRSLRLALGMWRRSSQLAKQLTPDIIEFYGAEAWLATDCLSQQRNRRFKIVAHSNGIEPFVEETLTHHGIHNTGYGEPPKWYQGRLRFPFRKAFSKADAMVTVSEPEAEYARKSRFQPTERVLAVDNALPAEFLGQEFIMERPRTIGFCGSWLARKGTSLLSADLTAALRQSPDWRLHLVGVGSGFEAAAYFPPDVVLRVDVTGFVSDRIEQRRIFHSWAIAVMPSIYESFGLVASEAMSCGCALVANRTGFAASLVDGEEALLLPAPSSPHLCHSVLRLIRDEELRRNVAMAGWKRVQSLRWEHSISQLEAFYLKIIGETGSEPCRQSNK
jgi:glycosyltransferase involved in cell wall biosynthesis